MTTECSNPLLLLDVEVERKSESPFVCCCQTISCFEDVVAPSKRLDESRVTEKNSRRWRPRSFCDEQFHDERAAARRIGTKSIRSTTSAIKHLFFLFQTRFGLRRGHGLFCCPSSTPPHNRLIMGHRCSVMIMWVVECCGIVDNGSLHALQPEIYSTVICYCDEIGEYSNNNNML